MRWYAEMYVTRVLHTDWRREQSASASLLMLQIKPSCPDPWLYLHLRGSGSGLVELTDGDSNWRILVQCISEGQNIQIKLLVPRAILSETGPVSSIFIAVLSEWLKAHCQLRGKNCSKTCFMMLRCAGHNTLHKLQHELSPSWMLIMALTLSLKKTEVSQQLNMIKHFLFSWNISQDCHLILPAIYLYWVLRALFNQISFKFPL